MNGSQRRELSPREAADHIAAGALLLDVRDLDEWQDAHVAQARLIPLGELAQRLGELPRDREIVVICRSGRRSAEAQDALEAAGFARVANLAGGMLAWQEQGLPVSG